MSNAGPYGRATIDGAPRRLPTMSQNGWRDHLRDLVDDAQARAQLGKQAYDS